MADGQFIDEIAVTTFYRPRKKVIAVLPPDDPYISDVGESSDEEEICGDNADDFDPDYEDPSSKSNKLPIASFSDTESEDDQPLPSRSKTAKKRSEQYRWEQTDFQHIKFPTEPSFYAPDDEYTPLTYFQRFFDDDLFAYISNETNVYSTLSTGVSINTTPLELKAFVGMEILMGVVQMPAFEDYWSLETRHETIAEVMPVKRFKKLRRFIHFQDNNMNANGDRLFKIRPILEKARQKCLSLKQETRFSVDEMMIAYKGTKAGNLRQYMPKKPEKWGFKMFVRAGVSGIVYDFLVYTGSSTFNNIPFSSYEESLGLGAQVVIYLCRTIANSNESVVYFDNFFCSLELIEYLKKEKQLSSLGTIRINRLRNCTLETDKALLKKGRGSFDYKVICILVY
uniref:PiggyBac transposable element-derived protein 2-like n=1 Tax=Diabrotica virgifera virgifera TaxID=50390 RepID=A0A6P7FCE4_DIAVI